MKKTLLILSIIFISIYTYAQPPAFDGLDESSIDVALIYGDMNIFGSAAHNGDWIAAFDEQDNLVGAAIINNFQSQGLFLMTLYGSTDQLQNGEMFKLRGWDQSEGIYYAKGNPEQEFGPFTPQTGGGYLPGFSTNNGADGTFLINFENILPIELSAFGVQKRSCNQFNIEWTTASEINNEYFSIQRSIDNIYSFETIDKMDGAGNSNAERSYSYDDELALNGEHTIYYRLKQTDYDGRSSVSNIILAKYSCDDNTRLQVYPNPFDYEINVTIEGGNESQVVVLDAQGKVIYDSQLLVSNSLKISTLDWAEGLYIIRTLSDGNVVSSQKVIKQN